MSTYDPFMQIPPQDVILAGQVVERYFAERGITGWMMGGLADRNLVPQKRVPDVPKSVPETPKPNWYTDH